MSFELKQQETGSTCVALPQLPPPPAPLAVPLTATYGAISTASVEKRGKKQLCFVTKQLPTWSHVEAE